MPARASSWKKQRIRQCMIQLVAVTDRLWFATSCLHHNLSLIAWTTLSIMDAISKFFKLSVADSHVNPKAADVASSMRLTDAAADLSILDNRLWIINKS